MIELMISVAVIGFIMSTVAGLIAIAARTWNLQSTRLELSQEARTAAELITTQLRMGSAQSVAITSSTVGGNTVNFSSLSFNRYDFAGTTWDTRFYMEQIGANTPAHMVYSYPVLDAATTVITRQQKILALGLTSLYFSYPEFSNPNKVEMNLSLSRFGWRGTVMSQQVREIIDIRNP